MPSPGCRAQGDDYWEPGDRELDEVMAVMQFRELPNGPIERPLKDDGSVNQDFSNYQVIPGKTLEYTPAIYDQDLHIYDGATHYVQDTRGWECQWTQSFMFCNASGIEAPPNWTQDRLGRWEPNGQPPTGSTAQWTTPAHYFTSEQPLDHHIWRQFIVNDVTGGDQDDPSGYYLAWEHEISPEWRPGPGIVVQGATLPANTTLPALADEELEVSVLATDTDLHLEYGAYVPVTTMSDLRYSWQILQGGGSLTVVGDGSTARWRAPNPAQLPSAPLTVRLQVTVSDARPDVPQPNGDYRHDDDAPPCEIAFSVAMYGSKCQVCEDDPSPKDGGSGGCGPGGGPQVNLATGDLTYLEDPGLIVENPWGSSFEYALAFFANFTGYGYGTAGLGRGGWIDNFDYRVDVRSTGAFFITPKGARVAFGPPTGGNFGRGAHGCIQMYGGLGPSGRWISVSLYHRDGTVWTFTPCGGTLMLSSISPLVGRSIQIVRDPSTRRVTEIRASTHDPNAPAPLLTMTYSNGPGWNRVSRSADDTGPYFEYRLDTSLQLVETRIKEDGVVRSGPSYGYVPAAQAAYGRLQSIEVNSPENPSVRVTSRIGYVSGSDRVRYLQDANNNCRFYTYDLGGTNNTLVEVKRPNSPYSDPSDPSAYSLDLQWTQKIDAYDRNAGVTDADGLSTTIGYADSTSTRPSYVTNRAGNRVECSYDTNGNLQEVRGPNRDSYGNLVATTYGWGYGYFPLGLLASVTEGSRPPTTYTYYPSSLRLQSVTSPAPAGSGLTSVTTTFSYTPLGQVTQITSPGNSTDDSRTTWYSYTSASHPYEMVGQVLAAQTEFGPVVHNTYDSAGRLYTTAMDTDPARYYQYNARGQVTQATLPAVVAGGNPLQAGVQYVYPGGPVKSVTLSEAGVEKRKVAYTYGKEGELKGVSGSVQSAAYEYDSLYRVKRITNGNSGFTDYTYNTAGGLWQVLYPSPGHPTRDTVTYTYQNGRVSARQDARSTRYYSYDSSGRVISIQPSDGSPQIRYGYDQYDRPTEVATLSSDGTQLLTQLLYTGYDAQDNLTSEQAIYPAISDPARRTTTLSYAYFADGTRKTLTVGNGGSTYVTNYTYDALGRALTQANPFGETTTWRYHPAGQFGLQQMGNGAFADYRPGPRGHLSMLLNGRTVGSALVSGFLGPGATGPMDRDALGKLRFYSVATATEAPWWGTFSGTHTFTYQESPDPLASTGRLAQEVIARSGTWDNTFAYDLGWNPTTLRSALGLSYGQNNERTGTGFTFDGNGNPTTFANASLTFDSWNHLLSYSGTRGAFSATYRGDGLRASKSNATTGTTFYVYDGDVPILELSGAGVPTAWNTFGANGLVSRHVLGAYPFSRYYQFDPHGNVVTRLDEYQSCLSRDLYDAYGRRIARTGGVPGADPWGYKAQYGYYEDIEVGLYLCTNRYYDPEEARWLTRDPIGYSGGLNLYEYCGGDPVNRADPSGLDDSDDLTDSMLEDPNLGLLSEYRHVGRAGARDLLSQPRFRPGSPERQRFSIVLDLLPGIGQVKMAWEVVTGGDPIAGRSLTVVERVTPIALMGLGAALGHMACKVPVGSATCFTAGTPVQMADGTTKPIEKVKAGDWVWSRDEATGQTLAQQAAQTFQREAPTTVTLTFDGGETLTTTPDHPFWVEGKGWTIAGELGIGTSIVTRAGPSLRIAGLRLKRQPTPVYNFEVAETHSYFVGLLGQGLWVHNGADCTALRRQFENVVKPAYWKWISKQPGPWTDEEIALMRQGMPPTGPDGFPLEVHHLEPLANGGTNDFSNLTINSRTNHRIGPNLRLNHPRLRRWR
ncbi:MAG TPA: polymorphic toxin-type HINT domain-containing protein [Armatimonadota bacterium]